MRGKERFELADHAPMASELQLNVEPFLHSGEAKLRDPGGLRRRKRLVGELGQRDASPQRVGLGQRFDCARQLTRRCTRPAGGDELFEAVQVYRVRGNLERVPTTSKLRIFP